MGYLDDAAVSAGPGWAAFTDPHQWVNYGLVLFLATLSGAALAYHPVYRGRPLQRSDVEQRKTLILYAAVGALIAEICSTNASMAFVIFGIGGLMRFRTDLGPSKNTGHTIVVTLIGLCWGLELQLIAAFATLYFWLATYLSERAPLHELVVGGIALSNMVEATAAYRSAIEQCGGHVTAHDKNFKRQELSFVVRLPRSIRPEELGPATARIPDALRGTPHWYSG